MSIDTFVAEAKTLSPSQLRALMLNLTDLLDADSKAELTSVLDSRRRAAEMKSGEVKGRNHEETFARARAEFGK